MRKKVLVITLLIVGVVTIFLVAVMNKKENKEIILKENKLAIMVDNKEESSFPSKADYKFEKVICEGSDVDATDTGTTSFNINIAGLNKSSSCVIYFLENFEYTKTYTYTTNSPTEWSVPKTGTYKIHLNENEKLIIKD